MSDSEKPKGDHVRFVATLPAAVVAAAITVAGNWLMRTPADSPTAKDVHDLRDQVTELKVTVATLSGQLGALAEDAKNQKVIEAMRQGRTP